MGQRQEKLKSIIKNFVGVYPHPKPSTYDLLNSKYKESIIRIYKILGGQQDEPPTRFGPWDVSSSKIILELDEERHFNRYRELTLNSIFYQEHKYFSSIDYIDYCQNKEKDCLRAASWGKNWKNDSTEKLFLKSNLEGDLSEGGSSRWRQRAFYDFIKDVSSQLISVPVIRISIYDIFENKSVNQLLLTNQDSKLTNMIKKLIDRHCL